MKNRNLIIIVAFLALFSYALAQVEDTRSTENFTNYLRSGDQIGLGIQGISLFDPSRMTFSHSLSSSYMASGSNGVMQNLFMETIGYRISDPLSLTVNMGYLNQPYSTFQQSPGFQSSGAFIGSAALTWRPRQNMFLHLEVGNIPTYGGYGSNPFGPYRSRYSQFDNYWNDTHPRSSSLYEEE